MNRRAIGAATRGTKVMETFEIVGGIFLFLFVASALSGKQSAER
jgi:hypothetical protein